MAGLPFLLWVVFLCFQQRQSHRHLHVTQITLGALAKLPSINDDDYDDEIQRNLACSPKTSGTG